MEEWHAGSASTDLGPMPLPPGRAQAFAGMPPGTALSSAPSLAHALCHALFSSDWYSSVERAARCGAPQRAFPAQVQKA